MTDRTAVQTVPQSIGSYRIERELSAGASWLGVSSEGRRVVLKVMEADCLLKGQLHPMIKDRLGRVRELAHMGVVNLLGAERHEDQAYLVWEYVEGQTLEQVLKQGTVSTAMARSLVLNVETMHALGIVHGALHPGNVIVTAHGELRLTHISPLLYNDPDADIEPLMEMLEAMGHRVQLAGGNGGSILRQLAAALASAQRRNSEQHDTDDDAQQPERIARVRRRAVVTAGVVALLAIGSAAALWQVANRVEGEPSIVQDAASALWPWQRQPGGAP